MKEIKKWHTHMERYSMFLGRKNQYFENEYVTKCNLQIERNIYQIPMTFFTELEQKKNSQIICKYKRHWIAKAVIRKKKGAGGISLPNFRLYCKATVIKKVWYRHKDRNIYQRNNMENPEINPHRYVYVIFDE